MSSYHRLQRRLYPKQLSLVIPAYNEEAVFPLLRERVAEFLDTIPCDAEVILVNDGSEDQTLELLLEWAEEDQRIKVLGLARNFGHQTAVTAGLDVATGDAVVILDADLQDPLEVIHDMLREYCKGYDVVSGQRSSREGETLLKRFTAWAFYRFMRAFIHKDLPLDTGDFRLISRSCREALRTMRETHRFLRGMVAWTGFAQTAVPYARRARAAGRTKYPWHKMIKLAWTAAVSFSPAPLRVILGLGLGIAAFGMAYGMYTLILPLIGVNTVRGWSSTVLLVSLMGGTILISIGILGEYVGRIFEELKARPLYIVSSRTNLSEENPLDSDAQGAGRAVTVASSPKLSPAAPGGQL